MVATAQSRTGTVAVVAHREKSLGGGLGELRAGAQPGDQDPVVHDRAV
jgi:hypothetical protein